MKKMVYICSVHPRYHPGGTQSTSQHEANMSYTGSTVRCPPVHVLQLLLEDLKVLPGCTERSIPLKLTAVQCKEVTHDITCTVGADCWLQPPQTTAQRHDPHFLTPNTASNCEKMSEKLQKMNFNHTASHHQTWPHQRITVWWKRVLTWTPSFWLFRSVSVTPRATDSGGRMKRPARGLLALSPDDFWMENNPLLRRLLCSLSWWKHQCFCSFQSFVRGVTLTAGIWQPSPTLDRTFFSPLRE